jgi:cell division protein FtsB
VGVVGKPEPKGPVAPRTRAERRRQAQARRNRLILVVGAVTSGAVVAAWFPASDLLHQRQQLAAASSELQQLNAQNRSLHHQAKDLETPAAVGRIAQQQYDLVKPGEQAYQVLPPSSSDGDGTLGATGTGARTSATRSSASRGTHGATGARSGTSPTGFLGRVVQTLEFWR